MRLGADALAIGIPGGSSHQAAMLEMLSAVTEEAHTWGMRVIRHSYPSGELWGDREGSTESVMCTARAAAECGTDIVKTWYTGSAEEFRRIVEAVPTPVVAAGGATRTRADQHPRAGGGHGGRRRRHDLRPQHLAGRGSDEDGPGAQGGGPRWDDALAGRRTAELSPRG